MERSWTPGDRRGGRRIGAEHLRRLIGTSDAALRWSAVVVLAVSSASKCLYFSDAATRTAELAGRAQGDVAVVWATGAMIVADVAVLGGLTIQSRAWLAWMAGAAGLAAYGAVVARACDESGAIPGCPCFGALLPRTSTCDAELLRLGMMFAFTLLGLVISSIRAAWEPRDLERCVAGRAA